MPDTSAAARQPDTSQSDSSRDTLAKLLLRQVTERGDRPAIREKRRGIWHTTRWRDLAAETAALAAALSKRSLQRGGHVAFLGDNRPRLYAAMGAAHWLGAVALPLYQRAAASELVPILCSAEVTHVFAENQEQVDKLLEILPRCPSVRCIVFDKDRGMRHYRQPELVSYDSLLEEGRKLLVTEADAVEAEARRGQGTDAAFLFMTSGTTGPAKGVVLSHSAVIDRARVAAGPDALRDSDVTMAYLPPGWIGQTFFSYILPMVVGYCVCCPESSETMLADMREIAPTCFLATPRVLELLHTQIAMRLADSGGMNRRLCEHFLGLARRVGAKMLSGEPVSGGDRLAYAAGDLLVYGPLRDMLGMSRIRVAYSAGDAIAPKLQLFFRCLGINLKQLYGSTETGFFVAMQRNGEVRLESVGRAVEGVELCFSPEREILVRSAGLFREYHRDPSTTERAMTEQGWFRTGDAGYLNGEGQLCIIDRSMNVGSLKDGTDYSPKVIENRLKAVPEIKEAVAFGDGRDMVTALIDIDAPVIGRWADRQSISYSGRAELASRDEVYGLIAALISEVNDELARLPALAGLQIRRFSILPRELNPDDGLLTRTGKLRRAAIADRYGALIEAMYEGRSEVAFRLDADGEDAGNAVDLKIRNIIIGASETVVEGTRR